MRRVLFLAPMVLAGCLEFGALPDAAGPYNLVVDERDSALPSFPGTPAEVYPVLLAHVHLEYPQGQNTQVVCLVPNPLESRVSALVIDSESSSPSMDSAPAMVACMDRVDTSRGAAQVERPAFDEADAVLFVGSAYCMDVVQYLDHEESTVLDFPGRRFTLEPLAEGGFLIDGERELRAGRALHYEYQIPEGERGRNDDPRVTVLIDHPGTWLRSRAGPNPHFGGELPPPPVGEPAVIVALPRDAGTLRQFLNPLLERPDGAASIYTNVSVAWMDGGLFDVSVRTWSWYADAVETTEDFVMVQVVEVGGVPHHTSHEMSLADVVEAFDMLPLNEILPRAGFDAPMVMSHIRAGAGYDYSWPEQVVPRQQDGPACQGGPCLWIYGEEPLDGTTWRRVHVAQERQDADAAIWMLDAFLGPVGHAEFYADA